MKKGNDYEKKNSCGSAYHFPDISRNCVSSRVYPRNEGVAFREEIDGEKHFLRVLAPDTDEISRYPGLGSGRKR